jgi:hypothetical protein|tara:strand:- start:6381 stop:6788 length:408 start_codon:yes stop_codon:yes gene_type:complete
MSTSTQEEALALRQKQINDRKEELVQVICRQTELTEVEAREQLENNQYDCMKVLNTYFGIKSTKEEPKSSSANQMIYGEIRNLMDTGSKKYRMDKERSEYLEKMKQQQQQQKNLSIKENDNNVNNQPVKLPTVSE